MVFLPAGPLLLGRNDILLYSSVEACILYRNVYVYHFLPCHYLYYCKAAFIRWLRFRLSMACIVIFIGGIQLLCIGILGSYLSRTYMEVKKRPIYICKESNLSPDKAVKSE